MSTVQPDSSAEREALEQAIRHLEGRRAILRDALVDAGLQYEFQFGLLSALVNPIPIELQ